MKKGISISLVVLMLAVMLHITVATHYCGGRVAASKVSISGKMASCGMVGEIIDHPLAGAHLNPLCCVDIVVNYAIDNNYSPSYSFVPELFNYNSRIFIFSKGLPVHSSEGLITYYSNVSPPGRLMSTNVDLSDICVFRI